jgi:hypothetical protein
MARHAIMLGGVLALCACTPSTPPFSGLPKLSVGTQFATQNLCDAGISPLIRLGDVPDGTASYIVQITDINVLIQTPWRETIPATSKTEIPEGSAKMYEGPCLGDMVQFQPVAPYGYQHRVEVLAVGANGRPLAYGATTVYVSSAYLTAKRERLRIQKLQQGGTAGALEPPPVPPPSLQSTYPGFPAGVGQSLGVYR